MQEYELLYELNRAANHGKHQYVTTKDSRQPFPGLRLELVSARDEGPYNWKLTPKQVLRAEKILRKHLQEDPTQ